MANKTVKRQRAAHLGPDKRQPMVLDVALDIFAERGYEGTSMDYIAETAGVTKPVVYECFPNKIKLFRALLAREVERLHEELGVAIPTGIEITSERQGDDLLVKGFIAAFRSVATNPKSWRLLYLTEHGTASEVANQIADGRQWQIDRTTAVARNRLQFRGLAGKELERKSIVLGNMMVGLSDSLIRLMLSEPDRWTPEELGEMIARLIAYGETSFLSA